MPFDVEAVGEVGVVGGQTVRAVGVGAVGVQVMQALFVSTSTARS